METLQSSYAPREGVAHCGRPWPAAYINFNQNTHQIQVLTTPLCRAQPAEQRVGYQISWVDLLREVNCP